MSVIENQIRMITPPINIGDIMNYPVPEPESYIQNGTNFIFSYNGETFTTTDLAFESQIRESLEPSFSKQEDFNSFAKWSEQCKQ